MTITRSFLFRITFDVNAELSRGTTTVGDGFEVTGLIGLISMFVFVKSRFCLSFGWFEIWVLFEFWIS